MQRSATQSVLVTGATGFIGLHLVRRLLNRGDRVTCLVRESSDVSALQGTGATLRTGDILDRASVSTVVSSCDPTRVFHLAGMVRAQRTSDFERVNRGGAETIAAACAAMGRPPTLIVVSSLAAVGPCQDNRAYDETVVPSPISHYGRSKLAGEAVAAAAAVKVPVTIVRPPIVFGPGDRSVLKLFRPIARHGMHIMPGRGNHRLSMIHVDDLVEGLLLAAAQGERMDTNANQGRGIYFLTADEMPTFSEFGRLMADSLDQEALRRLPIPAPVLRLAGVCGDAVARVRFRRGWINSDKVREALAGSWMCSAAKAREQLGWKPAADLRNRLNETAAWYRHARWL